MDPSSPVGGSKLLLTGGSLIALLAIWSWLTGKTVDRNAAWVLLAITFVVATFSAWGKQAERASIAEEDNRALKRTVSGTNQLHRLDRPFVQLSNKQLADIYAQNTALVADRMVSPYIGKWFLIETAILQQVNRLYDGTFNVLVLTADDQLSILNFGSAWKDHLEVLLKGQRISVIGKIHFIDHRGVNLTECELAGRIPLPPVSSPNRSTHRYGAAITSISLSTVWE